LSGDKHARNTSEMRWDGRWDGRLWDEMGDGRWWEMINLPSSHLISLSTMSSRCQSLEREMKIIKWERRRSEMRWSLPCKIIRWDGWLWDTDIYHLISFYDLIISFYLSHNLPSHIISSHFRLEMEGLRGEVEVMRERWDGWWWLMMVDLISQFTISKSPISPLTTYHVILI